MKNRVSESDFGIWNEFRVCSIERWFIILWFKGNRGKERWKEIILYCKKKDGDFNIVLVILEFWLLWSCILKNIVEKFVWIFFFFIDDYEKR